MKGFSRKIKISIIVGIIFLVSSIIAWAADVTLQWDANTEPDLAGYKIYYDVDSGTPYNGTTSMGGTEDGNTPIVVWLNGQRPQGNTTDTELVDNANPQITLRAFDNSIDWYFVATAFDTEGLESDYSNEVVANKAVNQPPPPVQNFRLIQVQ